VVFLADSDLVVCRDVAIDDVAVVLGAKVTDVSAMVVVVLVSFVEVLVSSVVVEVVVEDELVEVVSTRWPVE
jgi:electron transfer flavoprotein alpha/beta subunit